jgi:hypothetical protein
VIGQASYSLGAGATADVQVPLTEPGVALLTHRHHLAVTVLAEPPEGTPSTLRLNLKAAAKK